MVGMVGVWERVTDIEKGASVGCRVRSRRNGHTCARSELDVLLCDVLRVVGCAAFMIGDTGRSEGTHALGDDQNCYSSWQRGPHGTGCVRATGLVEWYGATASPPSCVPTVLGDAGARGRL